MADEIRTEEVAVEEVLTSTEDVNESLGWKDYAIVGGILAAGYGIGKAGEKAYRWTRYTGIPMIKEKFGKKKSDATEETQEHEADEKPAKAKSKEKKSETKEQKSEK